MTISSQKIFLILLFLFSTNTYSAPIETCIANARKNGNMIERKQALENCFKFNKNKISKKQCFDFATQINQSLRYSDLAETLNSICFYETTSFDSLQICLSGASNFAIADNHDEAIFDCYRQFQTTLSQNQCIAVSRKLIYPAKKNYLFQHCQNNP